MTQSVYIPFEDDEGRVVRRPVNRTLPPELTSYITQQQWDEFCRKIEKATFPLKLKFNVLYVLGCPFICLNPCLYKEKYLPRLHKTMDNICKDASDTILPGLLVQFKQDQGKVLGPEMAIENYITTYNFYLDIWLLKKNNNNNNNNNMNNKENCEK